jgi:tRNA1(Val) A37 N6-methylase TrmN6
VTADAWSEDRVLDGRLRVRQPASGYRIAIDPILLAAAVDVPPGSRVLDLGAGVGAASLALAWRRPDVALIGLERDPALARALVWNATVNGLGDRLRVVVADAARPPLEAGFDAVMTNPPFLPAARATVAPTALGRQARFEGALDLQAWVAVAASLLRPGGQLYMVHRADRLGDIAAALGRIATGLDVLPLWPKIGRSAKRLLVRTRVARTRPGTLLPGLVLHGPDGHFTTEAERILRHGGALCWETR